MTERNRLAEFYDAEVADRTGRLFDALKEIERLRAVIVKMRAIAREALALTNGDGGGAT